MKQKCRMHGCENQGEPQRGFDFFLCENCSKELENCLERELLGGIKRDPSTEIQALKERIRELEEGLKELVSASEALRKLVSAAIEYVVFQGPTRDKDCPGDDTCDCEQGKIGKRMDDAIYSAEALLKGRE
jgi:hypothetical protein